MHIEEITSLVNIKSLTHVAFVWHYPGFSALPFFEDSIEFTDGVEPKMPPKISYISNKVVELMKALPAGCKVDLLSCNLDDPMFKAEVAELERLCNVDIRYSVDQTGNNPNGNWVLESDNVDVKSVYFTDAINAWSGVLASSKPAQIMATNAPTYFEYDSATKTLKLKKSCKWTEIVSEYSGMALVDFISLYDGETLDGQGFTIDLESITSWYGLVSTGIGTDNDNRNTVKNLGILGGTTSQNGGFILRSNNRYCNIINCYSTGDIFKYGGGICGATSTYVSVTNCYSTGNIGFYSGGICGTYLGTSRPDDTVLVKDCYSTGTVGDYAGGIIAAYAGTNNGNVIVENCYSTGTINRFGGGILGFFAGNKGSVIARNCYSTGDIGQQGGGIFASYAGNEGSAIARNCYSTGTIAGYAGGILGSHAASTNGSASVENCYSTGTVGVYGGGIFAHNPYSGASKDNTYSRTGIYNALDGNTVLPTTPEGIAAMTESLNGTQDPAPFVLNTDYSAYPILTAFLSVGCGNILAENYDNTALISDDDLCDVTGIITANISNISSEQFINLKSSLLDNTLTDASRNENLENLLRNDIAVVAKLFPEETEKFSDVTNLGDKKQVIKYVNVKKFILESELDVQTQAKKFLEAKASIVEELSGNITEETKQLKPEKKALSLLKKSLLSGLKDTLIRTNDSSLNEQIITTYNLSEPLPTNRYLQIITEPTATIDMSENSLLVAEFDEDQTVILRVNGKNVRLQTRLDSSGNKVIVYGGHEYNVNDRIRVSGGVDVLVSGIGSGAFQLVTRDAAVVYSTSNRALIIEKHTPPV
jgi:hypothetical protein